MLSISVIASFHLGLYGVKGTRKLNLLEDLASLCHFLLALSVTFHSPINKSNRATT